MCELKGKAWEIVHIPDKPRISHCEQPTVDVFATIIEPKLANTLARQLNQIEPLENLRHVKRIQKKSLEGGKVQLSAILCIAHKSVGLPNQILEMVNCYQLSVFITKVCRYAALSKVEWEEQCKLWPTSYHPPTYNIDGITGFCERDANIVSYFMECAIKLAKSHYGKGRWMSKLKRVVLVLQFGPTLGGILFGCAISFMEDGSTVHFGWMFGMVVNAAVIVDPSVQEVIASACDEIFSRCIYMEEACVEDKIKGSRTSISCLYPSYWSQQEINCNMLHSWHPLRHAAIVAVEYSAARDRHLFPPFKHDKEDGKLDLFPSSCLYSESVRPYLCTGFDIYLVWEPCVMCAMALVHQRIRRIFFAFPNPNAGALGSIFRLQGERSLNHHYAVFRVLVPEEVLDC